MGLAGNMGRDAARGAIAEMKRQAKATLGSWKKKYSPKRFLLGKLKSKLQGKGRRGGRVKSLPFYRGRGRRGYFKGSGGRRGGARKWV